MRRARIGLVGLVLLLATLPATALADKDNTAIADVKHFTLSCSQSGQIIGWDFQLKNDGDGIGDFVIRINARTAEEPRGHRISHKFDLGKVRLGPGESTTISDTQAVAESPVLAFAEILVHRSSQKHTTFKDDKRAVKKQVTCTA